MILGLASVLAVVRPDDDIQYLTQVAKDTWASISKLEEPITGLPYDNSAKGEYTSVSNIGFYLASVVSAERFGFIKHEAAVERLKRTISSIEKLQTTFGFQQSWNSITTLAPSKDDPWVSVLDSGNLCAALLVVAQSEPEVAARAEGLFKKHDWSAFFDKSQNALIGGYNVAKKEFNSKWHLDALGTDATLAQFFAVATGAAPPDFGSTLRKDEVEFGGSKVLWPGQEGGGLFMQRLPALFMDLSGTSLGRSGNAYALAQPKYAEKVGAPVWGWSASTDPEGGYLGWAHLKDEVVTPHASGLASSTIRHLAGENLRKLEKLGARSADQGFYDAYNWKTGKVSKTFLMLDQGMMLVGLTSVLPRDPIRRAFNSSPVVKHGRQVTKQPGGWW